MLRVQTEAFQAANVALGQMKAAALPAPSDMGAPVGVTGSLPGTPDAITAGRDATPPHLQQVRWVAGLLGWLGGCIGAVSGAFCMRSPSWFAPLLAWPTTPLVDRRLTCMTWPASCSTARMAAAAWA